MKEHIHQITRQILDGLSEVEESLKLDIHPKVRMNLFVSMYINVMGQQRGLWEVISPPFLSESGEINYDVSVEDCQAFIGDLADIVQQANDATRPSMLMVASSSQLTDH